MGWGAFAAPIMGQVAGSMLGKVISGGGGSQGYDMALVNARRAEIDKFSQDLSAARSKYSTALGNMYNSAFQRFIPAQQARVAARGLSMGGGAYNASLGREVARYQSELEPQIYQAERQDLGSVDAARGGLFGSVFGASNTANQMNVTRNQGQADAISGMLSSIGGQIGGGMYNASMYGTQAQQKYDMENLGRAALPQEKGALSKMGRPSMWAW